MALERLVPIGIALALGILPFFIGRKSRSWKRSLIVLLLLPAGIAVVGLLIYPWHDSGSEKDWSAGVLGLLVFFLAAVVAVIGIVAFALGWATNRGRGNRVPGARPSSKPQLYCEGCQLWAPPGAEICPGCHGELSPGLLLPAATANDEVLESISTNAGKSEIVPW